MYIAPKSINEPTAHNVPQPARGTCLRANNSDIVSVIDAVGEHFLLHHRQRFSVPKPYGTISDLCATRTYSCFNDHFSGETGLAPAWFSSSVCAGTQSLEIRGTGLYWPHPSLIHRRTPGGKALPPFTSAFQCQYIYPKSSVILKPISRTHHTQHNLSATG